MKKSVITLFLVGIILVSPLVLAQEQSQTYSGFERFVDNVKLFFSGGENKVQLALEIREKEVNSAISNYQNQDIDYAEKNLEKSINKLELIQKKNSLNTIEEIKVSVEEVKSKIEEENLSEEFGNYILEEEKTQLMAELTEKNFEYCRALAEEDFNAMLREENCNPKTAPENLEKELKELRKIYEEAFVQLMYEIRSCIDDPGTCNCESNEDINQKAKCEKMVALAVKCEYREDTSACKELILMKPIEGDGFAESFVPNSSIELFEQYREMINYNIPKSDVPPECYNENERVKTECAQYRYLKELHPVCFDKEGNFLVEECGGPKDTVPTMQESIPQCFDENNNFLEEKCGKITIIWNEKGLINYIIETEIKNIVDEFENKSEQHKIEINKTEEKNAIKNEINGLENGIAERTFAPGTYGVEEGINDVKTVVVEGGNSGDGGLTPEVETEIAGGGSGGNDGLSPEVEIDVASEMSVDDAIIDSEPENNEVAGLDEGPGEPGVVDED